MKTSNKTNRRQFIKVTATGLAGATLITGSDVEAKTRKKKEKIIYRTLGRTGVKLPIVSMGAMRGESKALIKMGIDKGIVHYDTAHVYQKGKNELMIGEIFKDQNRDDFFISTKIVPDDMDRKTGLLGEGASAEKFMKNLDISLERLQMKQVDLLYLHAISTKEATLHPEMLKALKTAKEQGKTKFIGISTHKNEPEVIQAAMDAGIYDVVLTAYNFKQDHHDELKAMIKKGAEAGIGFVAMKTMAGGFLDKEQTEPVNTKAALKWVLQDENICTSIPGFTAFEHLEESFSVMEDLKLTKQEEKDLEFAREYAGLYCNQCDQCKGQCQKGLPIPEIMRAYMYTYGYRDMSQAKDLLANMGVENDPCASCDNCTVSCVKQFAIADKIKDVSRLANVPDEFIS
ncbi:MAG: aldo/keto reductase [Marinilabiliaceae bacterium]|nr:aldo/keto reductase [Marinilabiliaceae bacterium]